MKRFGYLHSTSFVPSMFVRRLVILLVLGAGAVVVLGVQTFRLTVVESDRWLAVADSRLTVERYTPTTRGRILDRHGRVLAENRSAYDVLIEYEVITGQWATRMAEREARRSAGDDWAKLSPSERAELIDAQLPAYEARLEEFWSRLAAVLEAGPVESGDESARAALERERERIKARVQRMANHLWSMWREERQQALYESGRPAEVDLTDVAQPIREQVESHAVAWGLTDEQAAAVRRLSELVPGVRVEGGADRAYPMESVRVTVDRSTFPAPLRPGEGADPAVEVEVRGVLTHVVGRMRELNRVGPGETLDTDRRPARNTETGEVDLGHYRDGDLVGGAGIEAWAEDRLRGLRGRTVRRLDTDATSTTEAQPGRDVTLTIDAALQARIMAVLDPRFGFTVKQPWHKGHTTIESVRRADGSFVEQETAMGTPLAASVVVLDVESGEILSMVTWPSYTRSQLQEDPASVFGDPVYAPWVNRAVGKPYAPGSIVKPMILCAAVNEGVHRVREVIECGGYLLPNNPESYRDWIYKQYGQTFSGIFGRGLFGDEAIGVSSNIFFYTLGRRLGVERITDWYERFGVGSSPGLGVGLEYTGNAGPVGRPADTSDAILMGIGQGPVDWTPMHAADAFATLARSGTRIVPRLDRDAPIEAEDLHLDPEAVDMALEGLRYSIEEDMGTGHAFTYPEHGRQTIFNVDGVSVLGKTGTAEGAPVFHDPDGADGPEPSRLVRRGDHAWFVGLIGPAGQPPRYAVSVLTEYAGSGGRVSGPIAEQVIYALKAEGYL